MVQRGKVDVVPQCVVCGQNLSSDGAETCGRACAKTLKTRGKIARRERQCQPKCPGWMVFESKGELDVERCDECWSGVEGAPDDEDCAALPEAQEELRLANADGDAYVYPVYGPPCKSCFALVTYGLWRPCSTGEPDLHCVSCGNARPIEARPTAAAVPREDAKLVGERVLDLLAGWEVDLRGADGDYTVTLTGNGWSKDFKSATLTGALAKAIGG